MCMRVCLQLLSNQSKFPVTGLVWVTMMVKEGHGQTKCYIVHGLNWCAFDHAFHASQLSSGNYIMCVCTCVCVYVCMCVCVRVSE